MMDEEFEELNPLELESIGAERLNSKDGKLEYECKFSNGAHWVKKAWLVKHGKANMIQEFEKQFEVESTAARSRAIRKSPRLSRKRTKSPTIKYSNSKSPVKEVDLFLKKTEAEVGSLLEKAKETIAEGVVQLEKTENFWLLWYFLTIISLLGAVLAKFAKSSTTEFSEFRLLVDLAQVFDVVPFLMAAVAVKYSPQGIKYKNREFKTRIILCLLSLSIVTLLDELNTSSLIHALPEKMHNSVENVIPDVLLTAYFIWIGFFFAAFKKLVPENITLFGLKDGMVELVLQVLSFIVVNLFDKIAVANGRVGLGFGYYAISFVSCVNLSTGFANLLSKSPSQTSSSEIYLFSAQWIIFFFTLVFVSKRVFGTDFESVKHLIVGNSIVHINTLGILQTVLKWIFAALLVLVSIK